MACSRCLISEGAAFPLEAAATAATAAGGVAGLVGALEVLEVLLDL